MIVRGTGLWRHRVLATFIACGSGFLQLLASGAARADTSVTLPGGPLVVSVGSLGQCQSTYANLGNNFFPPSASVGDCGFFLSFPATRANPPALQQGTAGTVFGFSGAAGPGIEFAPGGVLYLPVAQMPVTGSGIAGDPYTQLTTFKAETGGLDYAVVNVTTTYVNGAPQFTSSYEVQNITGTAETTTVKPAPAATLYFHAIVAGDLFVSGDDRSVGAFLQGPPRFIGGQSSSTGTLGGFVEAPPPAPPWTNYEQGPWNDTIWSAVRASASAGVVFNDTTDPNLEDDGAGVGWDQFLDSGLASGQRATFSIVNRTQVPTTLNVQPTSQALTVGQTGTIKVTATDNVGTPYAGRPLVYSITGVNPQSGSVTTSAAGVATITYVGTHAGADTSHMFLDLAGTGAQAPQDPTTQAQITWSPPSPPPPVPPRLVKAIQMFFAGRTVPHRPNRLRLIRIVILGTQPGEQVHLRCLKCGSFKGGSILARGTRAVFRPRHLTVTRHSRLLLTASAPGSIGRFKLYAVRPHAASATPLGEGCLASDGRARIKCP